MWSSTVTAAEVAEIDVRPILASLPILVVNKYFSITYNNFLIFVGYPRPATIISLFALQLGLA